MISQISYSKYHWLAAIIVYTIIFFAVPCLSHVTISLPPPSIVEKAQMYLPKAAYKNTIMFGRENCYAFEQKKNKIYIGTGPDTYIRILWEKKAPKKKVTVYQKAAEKQVMSWLESKNFDLSEWRIEQRNKIQQKNGTIMYTFDFDKYTPDGIDLKISSIYISIDTSGNIIDFTYRESPVTVSLKPTLTKEQLIQIAIDKSGIKNAKVTFHLFVADYFDNNKKQMLCMSIGLNGDSPDPRFGYIGKQSFILNAHTGEILSHAVPNSK